MYCPNCGIEASPGDHFCPSCGKEFTDWSRSQPHTPNSHLYAALSVDGEDPQFRQWNLPKGNLPGNWVIADGEGACLFLFTLKHLLRINRVDALFRAEYRGPQIKLPEYMGSLKVDQNSIAVGEARLLYKVTSWKESTSRRFSASCVRRGLKKMYRDQPKDEGFDIVSQSIDFIEQLADELDFIQKQNRTKCSDLELLLKVADAKRDGTLPDHPSFDDRDLLERRLNELSEKSFFEDKYLAQAAFESIGYGWQHHTFRAANKARDAIVYSKLRDEKFFGASFSKPKSFTNPQIDEFIQLEADKEEQWQANELALYLVERD